MEVHVVVSAAKGKSKVKRSARQSNAGDNLEHLRGEIESLPSSLLPIEDSEEVIAELENLPSPASLLPVQQFQETEDAEEQNKSKSKTVQAWHRDLLCNLRTISTPPKVTNSTLRDARKLFGVNCDNKVILRNPGHLGAYEEVVLLQFDPNFMSTKVVCRHPSCNNINPAAAKSGKRDLYLCPCHQQVLRNSISDALANKSVKISTSAEKPEPGHFEGYTSLISLLEGAYHDAKKFNTLQGKPLAVQEAILNVRNFLIITSTVLNPDEDNLGIALPPVVEILKLILKNPAAFERLATTLIKLLQEVIEMILFAFGVDYTWVSLALRSLGAKLLAVAGGLAIGLTGPWGWAAGAAVGLVLGGLFGNAIDNMRGEQDGLGPNRQLHYQYPVYCFNGDVNGGLYLQFKLQQ